MLPDCTGKMIRGVSAAVPNVACSSAVWRPLVCEQMEKSEYPVHSAGLRACVFCMCCSGVRKQVQYEAAGREKLAHASRARPASRGGRVVTRWSWAPRHAKLVEYGGTMRGRCNPAKDEYVLHTRSQKQAFDICLCSRLMSATQVPLEWVAVLLGWHHCPGIDKRCCHAVVRAWQAIFIQVLAISHRAQVFT